MWCGWPCCLGGHRDAPCPYAHPHQTCGNADAAKDAFAAVAMPRTALSGHSTSWFVNQKVSGQGEAARHFRGIRPCPQRAFRDKDRALRARPAQRARRSRASPRSRLCLPRKANLHPNKDPQPNNHHPRQNDRPTTRQEENNDQRSSVEPGSDLGAAGHLGSGDHVGTGEFSRSPHTEGYRRATMCDRTAETLGRVDVGSVNSLGVL